MLSTEVKAKIDEFANFIYNCFINENYARRHEVYMGHRIYSYIKHDPLLSKSYQSPLLKPSTPECKYLKKVLKEKDIYLYSGYLLTKEQYLQKQEKHKEKIKFRKDNKLEIKRQKSLIQNFRNMFRDEGFEITISGAISFDKKAKIVKIFEDNDMVDAIEAYGILHELKKQ